MESRQVAWKERMRGFIQARYEGVCPYCGRVFGVGEFIVRGERGWGHAGCVNGAIHVCQGERSPPGCGGVPLCGTHGNYQNHQLVHAGHPENNSTEERLATVNCKKCLRAMGKAV